MSITLHLMTQDGQPYGSERRCCERCGLMLVGRTGHFWSEHTWTDEPSKFRRWEAGTANVPQELVPCDAKPIPSQETSTGEPQ